MANIQPITTWFQGSEREANVFSLYSTGDNLIDSATFQYQLIEEIIISPEEQSSQTLIVGQLGINGTAYAEWDAEVDANAWIYNWAAGQLGLVII
ncbi:MAG: hypothetical protein ACOVOV_06935 [Dolichospermum sp.]